MAGRILTQDTLDGYLGRLAVDGDRFAERAAALARRLDMGGVDLEMRDPSEWRRASPTYGARTRIPLHQQFRAEVDTIEPLDREAEARLARRIEFARIRLQECLQRFEMTQEELVGIGCAKLTNAEEPCCGKLPDEVCRRWVELHALRTEMVERNLYLVLINVERYTHTTVSPFDLIQEGAASLFRAVDGFDWRRGLLFRTYAVHWLNQAFRSYLYNSSHTVRVPVYLQKAMKHIHDARNRLGDDKASAGEIAGEADLAEHLVAAAIAASRASQSMDTAFDDGDEGSRLRDVLESPGEDGSYRPEFEDVSLESSVEGALDRLSERERLVVRKRFGIGVPREHTLAEVARELGVSLERVRQIQVRALGKLNNPAFRRQIDPFLN